MIARYALNDNGKMINDKQLALTSQQTILALADEIIGEGGDGDSCSPIPYAR